MCKKENHFQIFLLFAIEMAILSVYFAEKDLDPLGVNSTNSKLNKKN